MKKDVKYGGGHHVCEQCGKTIFGSKIHTCKSKRGCFNCKANDRFMGICLMHGCMTLTEKETAEDFECEYWEKNNV
jgi:hypothetical protein